MNITNKIKKASAVRDKEAYMQAVNNRFGFKVSGKGTFIFTSEEAENISSAWKPTGTYSNRCVRLEVKSYELKVVGENHFWVVTELDGTVLIIDEIEFTKSYYYGKRSKKAKATDFIPPHKCFGYFTSIESAAWVSRDVEECPEKDSYYRWRLNLVTLIKETFK